MAASQPENRLVGTVMTFWRSSMLSAILCVGSAVCAQAQDATPDHSNESWTTTAQTSLANTSPSRTSESHARSGNRSVDKQIVEVLGPNGHYLPNFETETETILVDANTTRTVVRTYRWDVDGRRNLGQVTEEEARSSASGDARVIRTTANSDGNGNLQVVQREVADVRKTGPDVQETTTTIYRPDGNGGLASFEQTQELQKRGADHTLEMKKKLLQPDSSGKWEVAEVKESTIKESNKNRISEESISRHDSGGRLSEVSRTVGKETETVAGKKSTTVETYYTNAPGVAPDGSLHLNWQVTNIERSDSSGKTTEQQAKQPNPNDPSDGFQVSTKTKYVVRYNASGTEQTKTIQERDTNGTFNVVSVETQKSDQVPAVQGPITPSENPK